MFDLIYAIVPLAGEEALAAGSGIGLVGVRHDAHFGMAGAAQRGWPEQPECMIAPGNVLSDLT